MLAIYKKEMRSYFTTLIGYVYLFFFVITTAFMFIQSNAMSGNPNYAQTLSSTLIIFLILIPALTMRLFSEEMRQKTDQLLFTSPNSVSSIVIGKFLGAFCLFLIGFIITMIFPAMIARSGVLNIAATTSAFLGYLLMVSCFIAIGIFISSVTENQIISAVATFAIIFVLFIIDGLAQGMPKDRNSSIVFIAIVVIAIAFILYDSTKSLLAVIILILLSAAIIVALLFANPLIFDGVIYNSLMYFSIISKFNNFNIGILNVSDILYYITFCGLFIYLTINNIEKRRWK